MIGKSLLPKNLFGRWLLILVLPTVLIQLVMLYVFFDRHWDNVTRHMSYALAGETAFLIGQLTRTPQEDIFSVAEEFHKATGIEVYFDTPGAFDTWHASYEFPEYQERLRGLIEAPFTVRKIENGDTIETRVKMPDLVLKFQASVKRLESRTTMIYLWSMIGVSVVFLFIAIVFMRNQIRPIRMLAEAADNFGRGMDTPGFKPSGASEVRKAAQAFITMRERIKRQIRTRTDMLSGISHDLRTPLTRMKLQLAMLPSGDATAELRDDVQQMEHMIQEYLDFVRGEGGEDAVKTNMRELLRDVVSDYERTGADVTIVRQDDVSLDIRVSSFRRMLHNLIDNAVRYGKRSEITLSASSGHCQIIVDDEGPGIPEDKRDEVFRPFSRLEPSRNSKTGGVGLGLTIARDVILAHGGSVALAQAPKGGLRVIITLPL